MDTLTCAAYWERTRIFSVWMVGASGPQSTLLVIQANDRGKFPLTRHDNREWERSDTWRRAKAGMSLGGRGAVMQLRGDWSWLKQTFNFPSWSNKQICWRCKANSDEFNWRDPSANPRWRSQRLTEKQFFKLRREQSIPSNPIFELSHFKLDYVAIDALHALDLGFSQDVVGNVVLGVHRVCRRRSQLGPEGPVRVGALAETLLRDEDGTEAARPHTGHGATRRQGATQTPHPRPNATGELTQLSASSPSKVNTNLAWHMCGLGFFSPRGRRCG